MKYTDDIYEDFGKFFAKSIEIAKDKIGLYNQLLSPPMRKKTNEKGFKRFLEFIVYILRFLGWLIYVAIVGLVALGIYAYIAGMGTMIATNPVMAAAVAILGGNGVYLLWKHREFLMAQKKVGDSYKEKFEIIKKRNSGKEMHKKIEALMKDCVISLCVEAYQINNDTVQEKIAPDFGD